MKCDLVANLYTVKIFNIKANEMHYFSNLFW